MMQIVTWKEFAAMPEGTVFSFYTPRVFDGLAVKGETIHVAGEPTDFFYSNLLPEHASHNDLTELEIGVAQRWGMYDYKVQYCVFDRQDINLLIRLVGGEDAPADPADTDPGGLRYGDDRA